MTVNGNENPLSKINGTRIFLAVLLGLGIVIFLLIKDFNKEAFKQMPITFTAVAFLCLAMCFMVFRDLGYIIRIRVLTKNDLSWRQAFRVIMLWEFSSALMPSAVGGTTIAMIFVNREGISLGRSTAVVMATSFLDEVYFIIMFPLLLLLLKTSRLFDVGLSSEFFWFAVIGYSLKLIYTIVLSYGLFVNPRGLKWLLLWLFKLPFLRKFRYSAYLTGSDIVTSSTQLKREKFGFWLKAFLATVFSWTSRYWVVNALMLAFFVISDHFLLFARQLVMSNMMLLSPTPGASGFSEYIFTRYLGDLIPVSAAVLGSVSVLLAFLWRLISYYPYLIIGTIIVPRWLKVSFGKKATKTNP
jgi:glycosyltransferase 2 family protein